MAPLPLSSYTTGITLVNASTWFIVAFTVERCVVVRSPLRRLSTPRNDGLCCGSLLVLAFVKNIDLFFVDTIVVSNDDVATINNNNTRNVIIDVSVTIWRYGWPPLCMMGLVGNTLVLLVLRRDGLVRTSANVYLSALAVGDSLVLMVASVAIYPGKAWGWWFDSTSRLACHVTWPVLYTIINASTWLIVSFTVERCVVVRFPLLKLRLCTPRNAGLCCGSLLVLAFVKNIDLFLVYDLVIGTASDDAICTAPLRYRDYVNNYRSMINFVTSCVIPTGVVLVCNWAIIRTLRRDLVQTTARDSIVRHTTVMCLAVSFAFIVCVAPAHVFNVTIPNWPLSLHDVLGFLVLLRYANHAINFFLYSLTGAHFRCELVALFHRCIQRGRVTAGCVR
ncbi:hypothetical protein NP493_2369g00001 [Ridgeia piscesae]|uniref:G-protein coupled receptors family 1 profile domain-containing protein n=1 Tax=Ridgeia piscesae TaxID=27915 RepID=A0AAD9JHF4_RIDPI|nr:hypothetical protein NP493_2369g00001 [Ridgeia piscesae]